MCDYKWKVNFSSTTESSVENKSEVMEAWKGGMGLMVVWLVVTLEMSLILLLGASASPNASSDQIMPSHIPQPESCIEQCMRECKSSGIGVAACIKYCPVHCLPPETSSRKAHYCNLGCMLDQCAKFTDDEEMMGRCVSNCRTFHCNIKA